jgi:putative aldouronate transport system substrate-binding protein
MKKAKFILVLLLTVVTTLSVMAAGRQAQSGTSSGGPVKIEIFMTPWIPTPIEGRDPYNEFINQLTGAEWSLTYASDFNSEITTRAVAGDMPDLIPFDDQRILFSFYDQGILLDDWNRYKNSMTTAFQTMGETAITYFTVNGKLTCITTGPGDQLWAWNIRQDWLNKLGLRKPTTPDELFNVLRAFTFNDPDGNGRNDTYGITAAGGGASINELENLGLMYGPTGYYIADNKVSHPIIDGNYKKTLDFIKRLVDGQVIDPDWYTISWGDRLPNLVNGKYGLTWYPPEALFQEIERNRQDGIVVNWWDYLSMPKGSTTGGNLNAISPLGLMRRTVSAQAGRDPAKMAAITKLLDTVCPPNREYYMIRYGVDIDKATMIEVAGRMYIDDLAAYQAGARKGQNPGQLWALENWGKIFTSGSLQGLGIPGQTPQPNAAIVKSLEMSQVIMASPRNPDDNYLLNLNSDNQVQANAVNSEFTIQYIMGQTSDYDGFVRQWLASGGQALLDEATQQLKGYGRIK